MNLVKTLSTSAALASLLVAAPSRALQLPEPPSSWTLVLDVQLSDAEAALNDALAKLEAAKAEGADTAGPEAAVEQAKAALAAAQAEDAAAARAAEDAAAAQAAQEAEAAKAAEEAAAAKAAEDAAAAQAAQEAEAAKAAEEAAAAKAAEDAAAAQAAQEAEAAKAAEDAAAAKAAEDAAAAQAAQEAEAAKAAEEAAAAKAAEDAAAAQAAQEAEAAKAAEEAAPAPEPPAPAEPAPVPTEPEAAQPAPEPETAPAPEEPVSVEPTPVPADPETAPAPEEPASVEPTPVPAEPETAPAPEEPASVEPAPVAPAPELPAPAVVPDPVMEPLPEEMKEEAAPVLDSAKEELPPPPPPAPGEPTPEPEVAAPAVPQAPPPLDDQAARIDIVPVLVTPSREEPGEVISAFPAPPPPPAQEEIIKVIDNRTIFTINNITFVEAPEAPRLVREGDEVIIEQLPRGRTRETIVRANGVQVVTIKNRWGEIIQRSRILPDGREVILAYTPEYDREEYVDWRDPVYDLPPLQLLVPVVEYILDARLVEDEEVYYRFLDQPPVERVERTYSVQDVKRSARVRDKARRVEMGNITFGFGSADIEEEQINKLQGLADAMLKLIKKNPAETFLIEGHTDAVGSDIANLALSDERAESVAIALSNVFDVPSENLTTQGYGERFLKVKTADKEPLNRRVVFRRITPLVTPVASAE